MATLTGGYIPNVVSVDITGTGEDHPHNTTDTGGIDAIVKGTSDVTGTIVFQMTNDGPILTKVLDGVGGSLIDVDNTLTYLSFNEVFWLEVFDRGAATQKGSGNIVIENINISADMTVGDHVLVTWTFGGQYSADALLVGTNGWIFSGGSDVGSFSSVDAAAKITWITP